MKPSAALFLLLAVACEPAPSSSPLVSRSGPPNLVLIVSDDQGYGDYGFMGSPVAQTPNIDRLAREGSYFPVAYNTSSVCRPSMISLLTGLEPRQWKLVAKASRKSDPDRTPIAGFDTLPRILGRHGYATFQAGKLWESSYESAGFGEGLKEEREGREKRRLDWSGGDESLAVGRSTMAPVTDFIDAHLDQPFLVWFAPMLPHTPHDAPEQYRELYSDADLSASALGYLANVSRLDDVVGGLIEHLERRGLRNDTLVVFLADNGWEPLPDDWPGVSPDAAPAEVWLERGGGDRGKASIFELGWRTPLVFEWPGQVPAGVVHPGLVSTLDLLPTLLEYARVESPPNRSGRSLKPVIEARAAATRDVLYGSDWGFRPRDPLPESRAGKPRAPLFFARTARWRYVWHSGTKREALYDINTDPREEHDVAAEHPEEARRLRAGIEAWRRSVLSPPSVRRVPDR